MKPIELIDEGQHSGILTNDLHENIVKKIIRLLIIKKDVL